MKLQENDLKMVAASELEQILLRLSMPDNQTIQQVEFYNHILFPSNKAIEK